MNMSDLQEKLDHARECLGSDIYTNHAHATAMADLLAELAERVEKLDTGHVLTNPTQEDTMKKDEVKALLRSKLPAEFGASPGSVFDVIITAVSDVFSDGKLTKDDAPIVTVAVESLFDEIVVPYDFPRIPNAIEPLMERLVRASIAPAVAALFMLVPE